MIFKICRYQRRNVSKFQRKLRSKFPGRSVRMFRRRNVPMFLSMFLVKNVESFQEPFVSKIQSMSRSRFPRKCARLSPPRNVSRFQDRSTRMFLKLWTKRSVLALNQNHMDPTLAILHLHPAIMLQHQAITPQHQAILLQNQAIMDQVRMATREASLLKLLLQIMIIRDGVTNENQML